MLDVVSCYCDVTQGLNDVINLAVLEDSTNKPTSLYSLQSSNITTVELLLTARHSKLYSENKRKREENAKIANDQATVDDTHQAYSFFA